MKYFIQHEGEAVHRHDLLDEVWGFDIMPTTRTVDNFILDLRKKMENDPAKPLHIIGIRSIGYRFRSFNRWLLSTEMMSIFNWAKIVMNSSQKQNNSSNSSRKNWSETPNSHEVQFIVNARNILRYFCSLLKWIWPQLCVLPIVDFKYWLSRLYCQF